MQYGKLLLSVIVDTTAIIYLYQYYIRWYTGYYGEVLPRVWQM